MAILVTAEVQGQSQHGYDGMLGALAPLLKASPGFIAHMAHLVRDDHWRVVEIWNSKAESDRFFAKHVAPNLFPGVHPKRSYQELHSLVWNA